MGIIIFNNMSSLNDLLFNDEEEQQKNNDINKKNLNSEDIYWGTNRYENIHITDTSRLLNNIDHRGLMLGTKWWNMDGGQSRSDYEGIDWNENSKVHGYIDKGNSYSNYLVQTIKDKHIDQETLDHIINQHNIELRERQ